MNAPRSRQPRHRTGTRAQELACHSGAPCSTEINFSCDDAGNIRTPDTTASDFVRSTHDAWDRLVKFESATDPRDSWSRGRYPLDVR
jgi:hypothetical protein